MKRTTSFLVRVALMAVALALAVVFVGRGAGTHTVEAINFNPESEVSVSDPTPGANADVMISFSVDAPDPFVNITDKSTLQFIPKQWGINGDAPIGTIAGSFDALATLGILSFTACTFSITFGPTMYVSSTDTGYDADTGTYDPDKLTSSLDLEGHPGGPGFSGEFVPDPNYEPDMVYGGVGRYPDFLTELFPPETYGEPLVRLWGGQNVLLAAIPLNIVIFPPGAVPGYPPSEGYATFIVLLDPVAPIDLLMLTITSDLCTPLSLVNTSLGVGLDNPDTAADESGVPLMTNPQGAGDYVFKNLSWSQPDADDDGIENWLDTCAFAPNTEDVDGRSDDADGDGLDGACDPDPLTESPTDPNGMGIYDEDVDGYGNRTDLCPTIQNGIEMDVNSVEMKQVGEFVFPFALYGDLIGPNNQADADGDRIGDVCEGAEMGAQCANDTDDDGDGLVNDGCPTHPPSSAAPESGADCANDLDDDGDGKVNDGCPTVTNTSESGAQCDDDLDDDGDGVVNDGCPTQNNAESGAQCANDTDDDGDGKVNEGCPTVSNAETGDECDNALDDDSDGKVNDGCPSVNNSESGDQCGNALDDDGDGVVDDGCPQFPATNESGDQCTNAVDDDWDGAVNDGCPRVGVRSETAVAGEVRDFLPPDSIDFSSEWAPSWSWDKAFDGNTNTDGCTASGNVEPEAGNFVEAQWASPVTIETIDLEAYRWSTEYFISGEITMSNGFYLEVELGFPLALHLDIPDQTGITWVRFHGTETYPNAGGDACFSEVSFNLEVSVVPAECPNDLDDDGDGVVNDGCPGVSNAESGDQCANNDDDDGDGVINDGCPRFPLANSESGDQCDNAVDDDFDGVVNDGCPASPSPNQESGDQCDNAVDDDGDGVVNDGCPNFPTPNQESGDQCTNDTDDDFDGKVNDGCPRAPSPNNESGDQCDNAVDDDADGVVNDGCPTAALIGDPETGDQCANALDDDEDGKVNDGCPATDPGDVAKNTETGTVHHVILERTVHIYKHGVKLNQIGGPKQVKHPSAKTYNVDVSNLSNTPEEIQVAMAVLPFGCATVNGEPLMASMAVSVGPGHSGVASFTVDWSECSYLEDGYTLMADACHAGDPAPAGFFGMGACPGTSDGMVDTNPLDDVYITKNVTVGSP